MYGLTECFRCTYLDPKYFASKRGSIGKAIPNCEVYVVKENNVLCKPFEQGELVFRGPTVAKGYLNDYESRTFGINPFQELYKEQVVFSGDIVYKDEEDFLYFVGRNDAMIKKYGYRTNGFVIASEILSHFENIEECAIIAEKDGKSSEIDIIAFVKIKYGNDEDIKNQIIKYSKKELPIYMGKRQFYPVGVVPAGERL
jgi:acyl-coenzyme A synthetase/AMP-(fatty) acid ligase